MVDARTMMAGGVTTILAFLAPVTFAAVVTVNLTVDTLRFDTADTPIEFTTRAYNGRFGGPTIRVTQGDTLRINLENRLGPEFPFPVPNNQFRLANTTNLHLHGLHVSPSGDADNIFRQVAPGTTGAYEYDIPADHAPGTFWYHPHVHGSSSNQQGGGMAGALIVEPTNRAAYLPPAVAAMDEAVLLLQHLCFRNIGKYQDSTPYMNHLNVVKYGFDQVAPAPVYRYPNAKGGQSFYLANGRYQPNVTLAPGEFKRLRLVGAGTNAFLVLGIAAGGPGGVQGAFAGAPPCDVFVLAKDGVFVPRAYRAARPLLAPGSRIDLAVRCNATGVYALASSASGAPSAAALATSSVVFEGVLAGLVVAGPPVKPPMAPPSALPARPAYMPDLTRRATPTNANRTLTLNFETVGGPFPPDGAPFPAMHINGVSFATKDTFVTAMPLGAMQEWTVGIAGDSNVGAGNHPFHVHVNPYQVVAIEGGSSEALGVRVGEYRDTVPLWASGAFTIRFVPDRWTGRALIHCHMIPHVDLGMAAVANITDAAGDPVT